jgi:ethanolamine transporter EutH
MEKVRDKVIIIMMATSTATAVALSLGYIAHYDFGLSREEIRTPALVGAGIIAVLVAVEFFGKKLRKAK